MAPIPDPYDVIAAQWPVDGPHSPDRLAAACQALAELVRYANHATRSPSSAALRSAPEVYPGLGGLATAAGELVQLTRQLAAWAEQLAMDPSLRHDYFDPAAQAHRERAANRVVAGVTARRGAGNLRAALAAAERLAEALDEAAGDIGHLHHASADPDAGGGRDA